MKKIVFNKIVNKNIFHSDFKIFMTNNELDFSEKGICVIYGPNGTGKTSLLNTLSRQTGTEFLANYDGVDYGTEKEDNLFFVISDQNNRNIILGETQDFLLGDNIRREYELKTFLESSYNKIITSTIALLKQTFNLSTKSSKLLPLIENKEVRDFVMDIVNAKSKGANYNAESLIKVISNIKVTTDYDSVDDKFAYFIKDFPEKNSVIQEVLDISTSEIQINAKIHELEENDEAIKILGKFLNKDICVVCDNQGIDSKDLLKRKKDNKDFIINSIDAKLKGTIEKVIAFSPENDPFNIKDILINTIDKGEFKALLRLKEELGLYKKIYQQNLLKALSSCINIEGFKEKSTEYQKILSEKPTIADEDVIYIQEIISKSMDKTLNIERDGQHNLRILLDKQEFINIKREELPLSAGEQNFLSLTFEFLKAKNSNEQIVVIDDPISSFDSIYKNKIVFSLVRMLSKKKRIVLTHNIDLIRLLEGQYRKCFNLYILDNSTGATAHGFIPLKDMEKDMLIDLNKLLNMFREEISERIKNGKAYLLSMIPFMRGYARIINDKDSWEKLTNVMHGYKTEKIDIAQIYFRLFGDKLKEVLDENYIISVDDILSFNIDTTEILDNELPLLNKTLRHSYTYLSLRLLVEKTLVDKFNINTEKHAQLGDIIVAAFPSEKDINEIKKRVFLTSKKTLINEFNHFEGNLSIFQPAIDITDSALGHEKADIINFVNTIKTEK